MNDVTKLDTLLAVGQGDAYILRLRRNAAEERATQEAASATFDPLAKLEGQITQWYSSLAPEHRAPNYLMKDLARRLRARP
jgi:hypothetical protein